jgi:hypothetical protein
MTDESLNLLPCPFCGSSVVSQGTDDFGWHQVFCVECSGCAENAIPEKAIEHWNRRTPQPDKAGVGRAVAFAIETPDGAISPLGWMGMRLHEGFQKLVVIADGCRYVYAYRGEK